MTIVVFDTDFMLPILNGERVVMIPTGTQPGEGIILKELGVGRFQRLECGNLRIHIEMEVSRKLGVRSRELLEELMTLRKEGKVESQCRDHSMFGKLKEKFTGQ